MLEPYDADAPDSPAGDTDEVATAGTPLPPGQTVASEDDVIDALKTVHDPEIPVNIYDLGLIYQMNISESGDVTVEMTLTAPACPAAGELPGEVAEAAAGVEGIGVVTVQLVWDPPWAPDKMSEVAKMELGMW